MESCGERCGFGLTDCNALGLRSSSVGLVRAWRGKKTEICA